MSKIRLAIAGVGNCARSLVQGIELLQGRRPGRPRAGPDARRASAATTSATSSSSPRSTSTPRRSGLDASRRRSLADAQQHHPASPRSRRPGRRRSSAGPTLDGFGELLPPRRSAESTGRAGRRDAGRCATRRPTCSSSYLPVGSGAGPAATTPRPALDAGVAFVNAIPVFIARDPEAGRRSSSTAGVPIVGDDIKSQVGATIVHRMLARLFEDRGTDARPTRTS